MNVSFGFVEIPNLYYVLGQAKEAGCGLDLETVVFFAGDDDVVPDLKTPKMVSPRRILFGFLYRNAVRASDRFTLPRERLIEIGHQVEI